VAGVLCALTLVINLVLDRPLIDAVLFSLAIAVGIHPAAAAGDRDHPRGHRYPPARRAQGPGQTARVTRWSAGTRWTGSPPATNAT